MTQDKLILSVGAEVGSCLVDGLGDGVMVKAPGLETTTLRSICFGLLQVVHCVNGVLVAPYTINITLERLVCALLWSPAYWGIARRM